MKVPGVPFVQGRNAYSDRDSTKFGIAIHNTSNNATAEGEASYATRRTDGISAHFYVDADSVVQSLDTRSRAGHAGSSNGNEHAIAVEITGTNSKSRAWWLDNVAWDRLAKVLAVVCKTYDIVPRRASVAEMKRNPKVRAFYGHNDMRLAWGGTTHTDPGDNFPWDHLLTKVKQAMNGEVENTMPTAAEIATETLGRQYRDYNLPPGPDGKPQTRSVAALLMDARTDAARARADSAAIRVEVTAMKSVVEALAAAIQAGGGNVDTAAILAGVAVQVNEAVEQITAETRDAVADLGEGGASQVRGSQPAGL
ncbi:N-acetylmuramoyl-L-alanine amidase [Micromonospora echinospora]|uniref:N-acetylmuramoyl-L-alanine amidase n=1 Tax=Micromonospora echinospora TaxID=1877 RepID=UPI003794DE00